MIDLNFPTANGTNVSQTGKASFELETVAALPDFEPNWPENAISFGKDYVP